MKRAHPVVLGTLLWLLVVTVGSTLVWAVISRAGQEVVATEQPVLASSGPARTRPDSTLSRSPSPAPAPPPASASASSPNPPPEPVAQRRTWEGAGGTVVAQCLGSTVSLGSAQAVPGYAVGVSERGPIRLEVEFEGREDDAGKRTHLEARCASGVPEFRVATESGSGSDD